MQARNRCRTRGGAERQHTAAVASSSAPGDVLQAENMPDIDGWRCRAKAEQSNDSRDLDAKEARDAQAGPDRSSSSCGRAGRCLRSKAVAPLNTGKQQRQQ